MKKIIISFLLFSTMIVCAQKDTSQLKSHEPTDSTGFGIPDGKLVSKEIGTAGGTIASDDGRVELIFPAGSLPLAKTISIQPTTNPVFQGAGKAYRFEPSGIQFKKPVQVIFRYSDAEAEVCPPDVMGFSLQDDNGRWTPFDFDTWDSTAKTLKGSLPHFSGFTAVNDLMIYPKKPAVAVNGIVEVLVLDKGKTIDAGPYAGQNDYAVLDDRRRTGWFVNEVPRGDENVGRMTTGFDAPMGGHEYMKYGEYHAPRHLPEKNAVQIKLAVRYYSKKERRYKWATCRCEILVYDGYKVSLIHEFTGRLEMGSELIDSASFVVYVYPGRFVIREIKNYPPRVLKEGRNGPFKEIFFNRDALGSIHITELIRRESLTKTSPPEVHFEFPSHQILWYKFKMSAKGFRSEVESMIAKSIPEKINFIANGESQRYETPTSTGKFTMIVSPYRIQ